MITGIVRAVYAYLELRNKTFYYDIYTKSKKRQRDIINDIEKLRSDQSESSTQRADFLRSDLVAEKQYIKHLSAVYDYNKGRSSDTDS
jgi:tRNA A37 threonylcarbamoyladenosine modification protein TsaB